MIIYYNIRPRSAPGSGVRPLPAARPSLESERCSRVGVGPDGAWEGGRTPLSARP